jgi:uncharacterized protein (DUF433 family)
MLAARPDDPYAGFDPLDSPAYSIGLAAHYIGMPSATLKTWVQGRSYPTQKGGSWSPPLIDLPDGDLDELSFWNLVEAWVLRAMRVRHHHSMSEVREAIRYVGNELGVERPLAHKSWKSDGVRLFIECECIDVQVARQAGGQLYQQWYAAHLERIRWDAHDMAECLFPFTRRPDEDAHVLPSIVAITPRIAFGQPIVERRGVPTEAVFDRWLGGDRPEHLAREYELTLSEVDESLRWEAYLIETKAKAA